MNDLVRFDLNLLVAFDTLMTERGVTRAGRVLGITQAAMSNTLRRLRDIFDDPLFVKTGLRMEPTPRALELADPVRRALHEVHGALNQERFDPFKSVYRFRVGMVDYAAAMLLPVLLPFLQRTAPGVTLELVDVGGDEESSALESGTVDMVFSRFQWVPPKLMLYRLFQTIYVCVCRPGHPLVGSNLTMEAFIRARHIHYYPRGMTTTMVDEALAAMGLHRNVSVRLYSLSLVPFMVADSDLLAIMPEVTARYVAKPLGLQIVSVPVEIPDLQLAMAWHPRSDQSPPNIWLREQTKILMEGLAGEGAVPDV